MKYLRFQAFDFFPPPRFDSHPYLIDFSLSVSAGVLCGINRTENRNCYLTSIGFTGRRGVDPLLILVDASLLFLQEY